MIEECGVGWGVGSGDAARYVQLACSRLQWSPRKASPATVAANPEQPTSTCKGKTEKTFVNHKP